MGRNRCVAANCKNTRGSSKNIRFYTIPKEKERYEKWLENLLNPALYLLPPEDIPKRHVCSDHFEDSDYNKSGRRGFLVERAVPRKIISPVAPAVAASGPPLVPHTPMDSDDVDDPPIFDETYPTFDDTAVDVVGAGEEAVIAVRSAQESSTVTDVPDASFPSGQQALYMQDNSLADHGYSSALKSPTDQELTFNNRAARTLRPVLKFVSKARRVEPAPTIRVPKDQRTPVVEHLRSCVSRYKLEVRRYKSRYFQKCRENKSLKSANSTEGALQSLSGKINPRLHNLVRAEVRNYSRKPQARRWTSAELADFETMRQRGPKCFRGLPFTKPTRKTLTGVAKQLHLQPGINRQILELLRQKVQKMTQEEKLCTIIFDEMSIRSYLTLLEKSDVVVGYVDLGDGDRRPEEAEEVLVPMLRSIYGSWKLPLAFFFTNKKMVSLDFMKIFLEVIDAVMEVGLDVRALVTRYLVIKMGQLRKVFQEPDSFRVRSKTRTVTAIVSKTRQLRELLRKPDK